MLERLIVGGLQQRRRVENAGHGNNETVAQVAVVRKGVTDLGVDNCISASIAPLQTRLPKMRANMARHIADGRGR